jgi:PhnB protein
MLYLEDVDAAFKQATAAGAKVDAPPADMFWGDRYGKITDPFGHSWSLATHKEDVTPAEMGKRMKDAMSNMGQTSGAAG